MAVARYGAIRNIRDEDPYRYLGGTPGLRSRGGGPYRGLLGPRQYQGKANIPRGTTATKVAPEQEQYKPPDPLSMYTSGKEAYDVTFGDTGIFTEKGQAQMGKKFDKYGEQVSDIYNKAGESFDELWNRKWFGDYNVGDIDAGAGTTNQLFKLTGKPSIYSKPELNAGDWYPGANAPQPDTTMAQHWLPQTSSQVNPYALRNQDILGVTGMQKQVPDAASMGWPGNIGASNLARGDSGLLRGVGSGIEQANPLLGQGIRAPGASANLLSTPSPAAQVATEAEKAGMIQDVGGKASNLAKGTSGLGAAMGGVTAALSAYDMIENGASVGNVTGLMGGGMVAASFFSPALAALGPWGAGIAAVGAVGSWFDWW